jgi:ribonuclease HI
MPAHPISFQVVAHIDGASRGNPGPAAYGVVLESEDGTPLATLSKTLGQTTNNVAEYHALLAALEYAVEHKVQRLKVLTDSELLARQIQGSYKVRSLDLKPLHARARSAIARLESFTIQHVRREQNSEADRLANLALDEAGAGAGYKPAPAGRAPDEALRVFATFEKGILKPQRDLPFIEGEKVELEIRRKK